MSPRSLQIGGVIATIAAGRCWQMMDSVEDNPPPSTACLYGGCALAGVADVQFSFGWGRN